MTNRNYSKLEALFAEINNSEPIKDSICWGRAGTSGSCSTRVPASSPTGLCEPCLEERRDDNHTAPTPSGGGRTDEPQRYVGQSWLAPIVREIEAERHRLTERAMRMFPNRIVSWFGDRLMLHNGPVLEDIHDQVLSAPEEAA